MSDSTSKQGESPALPNNFSKSTPKPADAHAPKIGGSSANFTGPAHTENRGQDGTS